MAKQQKFGGVWTEIKLGCVSEYLERYNTALKNRPFQRVYIDGFAGTGYVRIRATALDEYLSAVQAGEATSHRLIDGSARLALSIEPPFDRYLFIEKCPKGAAELAQLRRDHPDRSISVVNGDANLAIRELCRPRWVGQRGVLFLDPFGLAVEWSTLETIARTQAIDMWYLFPLMGLNRHLRRDGQIAPQARALIDKLLGCTEWQDAFYQTRVKYDLFGEFNETEKIDFDGLSKFVVERLKVIFAGVASNPLILATPNNTALFLLCFAAGNPAGAPIAVRIAQHILGSH